MNAYDDPNVQAYARREQMLSRPARMWFRSPDNIPPVDCHHLLSGGWMILGVVEPVPNRPLGIFRIVDDGPPLQAGHLISSIL